MKHVRVTLTANGREHEVHPMYGLLTNGACVERATGIQWTLVDDALGILHYVEGDMAAFEAAVADVDPVVDYELEPAGTDAFYAYVWDDLTEASRAMFDAIAGEGLVVVPPILYREDGRVTMSLFGPTDAVGSTTTAMPDPVDLTVEAVGGLTGIPLTAESRLSDRQYEAVDAALGLGYYDVPRTASQADVAAALDCAPSTAAEHLRKAEATLVRAALRAT